MPLISWTCPNCEESYGIDAKYSEVLKDKLDCKKCVRKDPDIRTTLEMDSIYTRQDMLDRFFIMKPCVDCGKFTKQDRRKENKPCQYCKGDMGVASQYHYSIRTWNTSKVITPADRKKMGRSR